MEGLNLRGGSHLHFRAHLRFDEILTDHIWPLCDRAYAAYWVEFKKDDGSTKRIYYCFMAKGDTGPWYDYVIEKDRAKYVWWVKSS